MPHLLDFDSCLRTAKKIALEAGSSQFLPNYVKSFQDKNVEIKDGNTANLVTETDRKIQEFIKIKLLTAFPNHKFMGEEGEGADVDEISLSNEPTWIVDPIDGTTNFVHQFKMTVISIALSVDKQPVVAVIYCPVTEELFEASIGSGAFCNEFGATGSESLDSVTLRMNQISKLVRHGVHGIRMLGSAAYNLTRIPINSAQIYFEQGIHAWDIAAGVLILREAGGVVREMTPHEETFRLNGRSILAACSEKILKEFVETLELKY